MGSKDPAGSLLASDSAHLPNFSRTTSHPHLKEIGPYVQHPTLDPKVQMVPLLTFTTISRHDKESHHIPPVPKALSDAVSPKDSNVPLQDVLQHFLSASSRTPNICAIRLAHSTPYQPITRVGRANLSYPPTGE